MTEEQLMYVLESETLELEKSDTRFAATSDRPLTITVATNGELMRFGKVLSLCLDGLGKGLLQFERDDAYSFVAMESVVAIERERPSVEKERRRTGFL